MQATPTYAYCSGCSGLQFTPMRGRSSTLRQWAIVGGVLGATALIGGSVWYRVSGCWPAGGDLILITVDTLRPDRIGAYGYASAPIVA